MEGQLTLKYLVYLSKLRQKNSHAKAKICDKKAKTKMKDYADSRRNARPSKLQNGDTVLVQQDKTNKFVHYTF